jgi:hypothetical protein
VIKDDRTARIFGLEISGLPVRFYFRKSPFISEEIGGIAYTDLNCLESISDYTADLDPSGGIATYSPMSVSLVMDRMRATAYDPHVVFGRCTRSSSVWSSVLMQDIARDDSTPIIVVESDPQVAYPHIFHIGAESFVITSQTQVGDLFELTCSQRIGFRQSHAIRLDGTDTPLVTSEIVSWRGRQASIYSASVDQVGIISDNQVVFQGMIERSPEIADLTAVSLSVVPICALMDNKIAGPKSSTSLVHGYHYFDSSARNTLNNIQKLGDNRAFIGGGNAIEFTDGLLSIDQIMSTINSTVQAGEPGKFEIKYQGGLYSLVLHPEANASTVHQVFSEDIELVKIDQQSRTGTDIDYRYIADDPICIQYGISFASSEAPYRTQKDNREYQQEINQDLNLYYYLYGDTVYSEYVIKGIAQGWYERGEKYLLVKDSLGLPSTYDGSLYAIQINAYGKSFKALAKSETAVSVGYIIELDQDNDYNRKLPSFGDFLDSNETIEISRGILIENKPIGEVMLEILESGGGSQINGTYDVHLVGCNLNSSFINETSFLAYQGATNVQNWEFNLSIDDLTARDIIEPMLKVMGCAIVMDRSSFYPRLKLISIGHESQENQALITDDDMLVDPSPYWTMYEDIITQFKFIYDLQNEQPTERIINNYSAINLLAGETRSEEYKLYGLTSSIVGSPRAGDFLAYFRPTYARLFELYGQAIRQWIFSITTGKAFDLDVGSTLRVSSKYLKGYGDLYGITDQVGLIVSMQLSLFSEGCALKVNHYGLSSPTWNASARIDTVINTTTIEIISDLYSDNDISFFKVGDVVSIYTMGASDTRRVRTISAISGNQITFTSTHGSSAGDVIQPSTYTTASLEHKSRAYIDREYKYE